jgi:hypothetical protein
VPGIKELYRELAKGPALITLSSSKIQCSFSPQEPGFWNPKNLGLEPGMKTGKDRTENISHLGDTVPQLVMCIPMAPVDFCIQKVFTKKGH